MFGMLRRHRVLLPVVLFAATVACSSALSSGFPAGRVLLKFCSPGRFGGVTGKLVYAGTAGDVLAAEPGSFRPGAYLAAFDVWCRLGSGQASGDGSVRLELSRQPSGPVAVLELEASLPPDWVPYCWEQLPSVAQGRFKAGMAFSGGKVWVFGGSAGSSAGFFLNSNYVWCAYDPASNSWSYPGLGSPAPSQRMGHAMAAAPGGAVYVFGGGNPKDGAAITPGELWRWSENRWQLLTNSGPCGRSWTQGAFAGSKFYVFGGRTSSGAMLSDIWEFDPAAGVWSEKGFSSSSKPVGRCQAALASLDGRVYVHGGYTGSAVLSDTWCYDPATDSWRQLAGGPALRDHTMVAAAGRLFVYGGSSTVSGSAQSGVWEYDPAADVWRLLPPVGAWPPARYAHAACVDDAGRMYVLGSYPTPDPALWRFAVGFVP